MNEPLFGAYSAERAPFSGTSYYRQVDDGKEVEVTMVTDDPQILESYLRDNKDAIKTSQLLRSSHRDGKIQVTETAEITAYSGMTKPLKETKDGTL